MLIEKLKVNGSKCKTSVQSYLSLIVNKLVYSLDLDNTRYNNNGSRYLIILLSIEYYLTFTGSSIDY